MAQLPVEVADLRSKKTLDLSLAVELANACQPDMLFLLLDEGLASTLRLSVLTDLHTGQFFNGLQAKRQEWRGFHPYILAVVDSDLHSDRWENLFSSRRAEVGLALVTTSGVEGDIIPSGKMPAYFLYELAVHTLAFIVQGREHHLETRGCVFDFKERKESILQSMKAGALCDVCRQWFLDNGDSLSASQLASFERILESSSELLRRVAASQAASSKARIFVASSMEGLEVARLIQSELAHDYSVEIWNQNTVFGLGSATIEALEIAVETYQYGIFVFTPDDVIVRRGTGAAVPRDNVIFEGGLFIGRLGRFRSFIVHPDTNIQLPSDLHGVTTATYDPNSPNLSAALGPACQRIRQAIRQVGNIPLRRTETAQARFRL